MPVVKNKSIRIGMLGTCAILVDGQLISGVPSSFYKIAAFLLLSGRQESVSRQRLRSILWSEDGDAERAAANLRRSIARIRELQAGLGFSLIQSNFNTVYLNKTANVSWDLRDYLRTLSSGNPMGEYPGELLADLKNTGPDFEDWLAEQRAMLRSRHIDRLAEELTRNGTSPSNRSGQLALAQKILTVDPCNEEAYRLLMLDAADHNNLARLEQIYQKCEAEMKRELGVSISSETRKLYANLVSALTG
ncbi:BTAD domain-containing putative transcriptional regulator [Pelagibacterium sp. H642]|uniref:AfsR/SARP family transcriptional regulator n=1 Tax=Pelagibacterium sp. H642 TaxID=1881069 RepID=UPI0028155983|nr:BTAD domain-containing putative transcriptional regulator [Pelagibacterium sp. H642]WMT89083.1 hypothetical protein NO934_09610 [Pelagibacterium sp. H642]